VTVSQVIVIGLKCADACVVVRTNITPHAASVVPIIVAIASNGRTARPVLPRPVCVDRI